MEMQMARTVDERVPAQIRSEVQTRFFSGNACCVGFRFRQNYVRIERELRSLYSPGAAPILEGSVERTC